MWRSSIQTPLFHGVNPTFAHTRPSASIARFAICAELSLFERCGVTGRESTSAAEAQDRIRRDDGPKPVPPTVRLDPEPVQNQHARLCELWIVVVRNADRTVDGDHDRADDVDPITTGSVGEIGEGDARFEVEDDQPGVPDVAPVVLGVWMIDEDGHSPSFNVTERGRVEQRNRLLEPVLEHDAARGRPTRRPGTPSMATPYVCGLLSHGSDLSTRKTPHRDPSTAPHSRSTSTLEPSSRAGCGAATQPIAAL